MTATVKILRSIVPGRIPAVGSLSEGVLAVNLADKAIYTLDETGENVIQLNVTPTDLQTYLAAKLGKSGAQSLDGTLASKTSFGKVINLGDVVGAVSLDFTDCTEITCNATGDTTFSITGSVPVGYNTSYFLRLTASGGTTFSIDNLNLASGSITLDTSPTIIEIRWDAITSKWIGNIWGKYSI
jgi:hypothetical protein